MDDNVFLKRIYFVLLAMLVVLVGFLCKVLSSVILPIFFAFILGTVLLPIVKKMNEKLHMPWALSSILMTFFSLLLVVALSSLVVSSLTSISSELPKYENRFLSIYNYFIRTLNIPVDEDKSIVQTVLGSSQLRQGIQKIAVTLSSGVVGTGKNIFMVFFLMAFFLIEARYTQTKVEAAFKGEAKMRVYRVSNKIVREVIRYISIKFNISLITGILVFLGTFLLKIDFPIVWGFLAFVLNFIPTFGSIFSTVLTTLFALLQFYPSWWQVGITFVIMLAVNFTLGNILEPRIEGKNLGLSPLVILISLSVWGYIWGFLGMLLAVPMMVIIKIVCEYIPYLNSIAVILGNASDIKNKKETPSEK
ncbi:MAG: AI-2E family transporter [Treponema sp.]|nr:AI-2E family transporter [Treponema sp.]